jgi:ACT domain-containing protein
MIHQKPSDYIVKYTAYDNVGRVIKSGSIRAKNKFSDIQAGLGVDTHIKATIPNVSRVQIHSCKAEDFFVSMAETMDKLQSMWQKG